LLRTIGEGFGQPGKKYWELLVNSPIDYLPLIAFLHLEKDSPMDEPASNISGFFESSSGSTRESLDEQPKR